MSEDNNNALWNYKSLSIKAFFVFLCLFSFSMLSTPKNVCATPTPTPTTACDPEYYDALEARAWMEAEREIAQNQNFIFKPDSVLEYSCFDRLAVFAAHNRPFFNGIRQFSETNWFMGIPPPITNVSTNHAILATAGIAFHNYTDLNYPEPFLNDTPGTGLDYPLSQQMNMAQWENNNPFYDCPKMRQVWEAARCLNFPIDNSMDDFYEFSEYQSQDPRDAMHPEHPRCEVSTGLGTIWGKARMEAFNKDEAKFDQPNGTVLDGQKYEEDPVVTHLDKIEPGQCTHGIETGIKLEGGGDEKICTNPGCASC